MLCVGHTSSCRARCFFYLTLSSWFLLGSPHTGGPPWGCPSRCICQKLSDATAPRELIEIDASVILQWAKHWKVVACMFYVYAAFESTFEHSETHTLITQSQTAHYFNYSFIVYFSAFGFFRLCWGAGKVVQHYLLCQYFCDRKRRSKRVANCANIYTIDWSHSRHCPQTNIAHLHFSALVIFLCLFTCT